MTARLRTSSIAVATGFVLVATAALATWALAAAVQPATHVFVKGEYFRYSSTLALGLGEGVVVIDGPQTMTSVEEIRVADVSASGITLANHIEYDKATGFAPSTTTIRASLDGTWLYPDGRITENFVTWDPVQLGAQPSALTAGQHWDVDIPRTASLDPSHAVVRVVSADPGHLTLHVESAPVPGRDVGTIRITNSWYADVVFEHGVVSALRRTEVQHMDRGPGTGGADQRTERRMQLLSHTTP